MPSLFGQLTTRIFTLFIASSLSLSVQAGLDAKLLEGLSARALGPATVSGRITAIDAIENNPNHIVIGTANGGVWISENAGLNWTPVFDDQPVASIGAVAIFQKNPDIVWVGTGEGNVRNSVSVGGGVFKSIDGGQSWTYMGLRGTERINRLALHPDNPDIAYAAALGTLWGDNTQRGIYRTVDGGKSWQRILSDNERSGGSDVKIDPFNPNKVYASLWEHRRWPYQFKSGGAGSGLYISWDGGENWTRKTKKDGLPEGELGRMTISPSRAQKGRVYALVEAEKSALMRSDDGGRNWNIVNETPGIASRPFYYSEIAADPTNAERVYNIYENLSVSIDGGQTFETNPVIVCCAASNTVHIDIHSLWINPSDASHLILGNDGGIAISRDRGESWRYVRNLPLSQFYHIAVDNDDPYHVYGGMQDNGSWRGPAEVYENAGIRNFHWQEVGFGDGFDTQPDPENSRRGYVMSQGGYLSTWNLDTGEQRSIRPAPPEPGIDLRFNWNAALAQDPFDSATIYYGSQFVHKSSDRGQSWSVISDDLTSNNPDWQKYRESGGLTLDVTAAENYTSIVSIAPSLLEQGVIWVGTDDGRVHATRNGGESWTRIDERAGGVPKGSWVPMITPSSHDAGTAFVVFDNHRRSDMEPYVYRVTDYGRRWESLVTEDLSGYALSVLQDHVDPDLLFLGTEFGLFVSTNGGDEWFKFTAGVPTTSVMDMAIQKRENDLVLGTHGRSAFVIDDYSALRGLEESDFDRRLEILAVTPGQQYIPNQTPSTRFPGSGEFRAENEPFGVMVTFMASGNDLPEPGDDASKDEVKIEVTVQDASGETIRRYKTPVQRGVNRLVWGTERDGTRPAPAAQPFDDSDGLPGGPAVPAGNYKLTLSLEAEDGTLATRTQEVQVLHPPRSRFSEQDRLANYQARLEIMALNLQVVEALERLVGTRSDIDAALALLDRHPEANSENLKTLKEQAEKTREGLDDVEDLFRRREGLQGRPYLGDRVTSRINDADYQVSSTLAPPNETARTYIELAQQTLSEATRTLDQYLANDVAELARAFESSGIGLFRGVAGN